MTDHHKTILLVDDETNDLEAIGYILEEAGYTVLYAGNYYQALEVAKKSTGFSILIVDVALPGKNGIELSNELLQRYGQFQVLFISGYSGSELLRFYGISMSDLHFLAKPFPAEQLLLRLEDLVSMHREAAAFPGNVQQL